MTYLNHYLQLALNTYLLLGVILGTTYCLSSMALNSQTKTLLLDSLIVSLVYPYYFYLLLKAF